MAILLEERTVILEMQDLAARRPIVRPQAPLSRAKGWHASDLLRDIAIEHGWLKEGSADDQEARPNDYPWRWALGQSWEEYWFSFLGAHTIWQPGERSADGIAVNADGFTTYADTAALYGKYDCCVEETKHTEKKVRDGQEFMTEKMWMHQGRGYVLRYVPGAEKHGGVCRWTVMYYVGDRRGSGPVCKQYAVVFNASECLGTWELFLNRKKLLEERGMIAPGDRVTLASRG